MAAEPAKRPVASPARVDMFTPVTKSPPIKSPEQKRIKVGPEEEVETPSPSPETCSMGASPEVKTPREDLSASFDASAAVDKTPVSANSSRVKDIMVSCTDCFIFLGWRWFPKSCRIVVDVSIYTHMYTQIYIYIYPYIFISCIYRYDICIYTYTYMYIHIYIYKYVNIYSIDLVPFKFHVPCLQN